MNRREATLYGARAFLVEGLITDCAAAVRAGAEAMGWFDVSTLKEPYRIEGKKTMGLELAEQLGWTLPDAILYPTGGGTGLIGMWKAFEELDALGWLENRRRPRMFSCQAEGCAPIVRAFEAGERFAAPIPHPETRASGLRVPQAVGDFMILDAIRASGGRAQSAAEERISPWMRRASSLEGIALCPETAVCLAVLEDLLADGSLSRDARVVVFNTGAAQKYVELLGDEPPRLPGGGGVDWASLVQGSPPPGPSPAAERGSPYL